MLTDAERAFCGNLPVARLATADATGAPHVVPVCFALVDETIYITIDGKPKGDVRRLKRLRNISENDRVAVVVDHYDDDWTQLGWVMLRGVAEILESGSEHQMAQEALRGRYAPYRSMALAALPVIAIRIYRVTSWGRLG